MSKTFHEPWTNWTAPKHCCIGSALQAAIKEFYGGDGVNPSELMSALCDLLAVLAISAQDDNHEEYAEIIRQNVLISFDRVSEEPNT